MSTNFRPIFDPRVVLAALQGPEIQTGAAKTCPVCAEHPGWRNPDPATWSGGVGSLCRNCQGTGVDLGIEPHPSRVYTLVFDAYVSEDSHNVATFATLKAAILYADSWVAVRHDHREGSQLEPWWSSQYDGQPLLAVDAFDDTADYLTVERTEVLS